MIIVTTYYCLATLLDKLEYIKYKQYAFQLELHAVLRTVSRNLKRVCYDACAYTHYLVIKCTLAVKRMLPCCKLVKAHALNNHHIQYIPVSFTQYYRHGAGSSIWQG